MAIRTLIVDDSADTRDWLRCKLESLGCEVVGEAETAAEGLKQFLGLRPKLITLDIMMPEIEATDAMALFARIRQEDSEAAVLIVSARPAGAAHAYFKLGAIGFVQKGFIDFHKVASLLKANFPELEVAGAASVKQRGLSSRLAKKS